MTIALTLRDHETHAGTTLVHKTSEDVVLGNVFGIVKNLPYDAFLNPWPAEVTSGTIPVAEDWLLSFWESQPIPIGVRVGSTKVDLDMDSTPALVFAEVKMDADPSAGNTHPEKRNQIVRNLDVGYAQARRDGKAFAVDYITPDEPDPRRRQGRAPDRREFILRAVQERHRPVGQVRGARLPLAGELAAAVLHRPRQQGEIPRGPLEIAVKDRPRREAERLVLATNFHPGPSFFAELWSAAGISSVGGGRPYYVRLAVD